MLCGPTYSLYFGLGFVCLTGRSETAETGTDANTGVVGGMVEENTWVVGVLCKV